MKTELSSAPVRRSIAGIAAAVAAVVALGCVVIFGVRAYDVYFDQLPVQSARDDAVSAAEQAMINVTTIDPSDLNGWQKRIQASFTGEALTQVEQQVSGQLSPALQKAGNQAGSTTSRLVRSAPTQVNSDEGSAQVLVYVAVSGHRNGEASATQTMGFLVDMTDSGDLWKAQKVVSLDSYALDSTGASTSTQGGGN